MNATELSAVRTPATPAFSIPDVLAKELSRYLEEQIIFGDIPPGSRLVEEVIVRQHGVSRSPVREAFRALERDGLLVRQSRKGVTVSSLTLRDLDEIYSCRLMLEGLAAEEAAKNRSDAQVHILRQTLHLLEAAFKTNDARQYFRYNVMMSEQISQFGGNATLRRLLDAIGKQALRYRYVAYSHSPAMIQRSIAGNQEIVEAIARQNARHARSLTEDLIHQSWQEIRGFLSKDDLAVA
jgi:DNA-binding GntR family transcriptional regulator